MRASNRAAVYVRVSTTGQAEEGSSLATQEAACLAYAHQHGYTVAEVFRETHTGTELWERPQLTALREQIRRREVDVVVAYAIDRLSRDPVHLGVVVSEADHAGTAVEFVTEPMDGSDEGQLIRFIRGYAAKVEHLKIVERTQRGKIARARAGRIMVGRMPLYGYAWVGERKDRYIVNPTTAPIVQRIFAEASAGHTVRTIARGLSADGIPTPTGLTEWDPTAVSRVLHNRTYGGAACAFRHQVVRQPDGSKRQVIRPTEEWIALPPETVPAIVSPDIFSVVEQRLQLNKARAVRNNRNPEATLLRGGFARCGYCGRALVVASQSANSLRYACHNVGTVLRGCRPRSISAQLLDQAVWTRVVSLLTKPAIIAQQLERLQDEPPDTTTTTMLDHAIAKFTKQQAMVARGIAELDDPETMQPLTTQLTAITAQKRLLLAQRDAVLTQQAQRVEDRTRLTGVQDWIRAVAVRLDMTSWEQRRLALDALGVSVEVFGADHTPRYIITTLLPLPAPEQAETAPAIVMQTSRG